MILVALLFVVVTVWLGWEWWSGAMIPPDGRSADRMVAGVTVSAGRPRVTGVTATVKRTTPLPTSAALNADAAVIARMEPLA